MDKINRERIAKLHPLLRDEATAIIEAVDARLSGRAKVRVTHTLRTWDEQMKLYNQGRTTPGPIVTNAKPEQTYHYYGLALDFTLILDGKEVSWNTVKDYDCDGRADWMEVVDEFVKARWTWGADWDGDGKTKAQGDKDENLVDAPHVQKTFGYSWRELAALRGLGKVDREGYIVFS
jgi:peptidoglycan LD-endopeptidase CwlK